MRYKFVVLVLVGIAIGIGISPVISRVSAQQKKYVRLTTPRIPAVKAEEMTPEQKREAINTRTAMDVLRDANAVVVDDPLKINGRRALSEDVAQGRAEQEATELVQDRTDHLQLLPWSHLLVLRPKELEARRVVQLRGKLRACRSVQ